MPEPRTRFDRRGVHTPDGRAYSWGYYGALLAAFVLLVIAIVGIGRPWTNLAGFACIALALLQRPGGWRGTSGPFARRDR